jgi:hypothetical protein
MLVTVGASTQALAIQVVPPVFHQHFFGVVELSRTSEHLVNESPL